MGRGPFVAVVDDDPDSAEMLVKCLDLAGVPACCRVTHGSAADRLPPCVARHPAAVIYDVGWPYEGALEEFRAVRAAAFPAVPVILTTTDRNRLVSWLHDREVVAVLLKPFDLRQVREAVRQAVGQVA